MRLVVMDLNPAMNAPNDRDLGPGFVIPFRRGDRPVAPTTNGPEFFGFSVPLSPITTTPCK